MAAGEEARMGHGPRKKLKRQPGEGWRGEPYERFFGKASFEPPGKERLGKGTESASGSEIKEKQNEVRCTSIEEKDCQRMRGARGGSTTVAVNRLGTERREHGEESGPSKPAVRVVWVAKTVQKSRRRAIEGGEGSKAQRRGRI